MIIEITDVSEHEMINFISDIVNDLELTDRQIIDLNESLRVYGVKIIVHKKDGEYTVKRK